MDICDFCVGIFKLCKSDVNTLLSPLSADPPSLSDTGIEQPIEKKAKLTEASNKSLCILCLGLSNEVHVKAIVFDILKQLDAENYCGVSTFSIAVHAPLSLKVRRMGMEHLVRQLHSSIAISDISVSEDMFVSDAAQSTEAETTYVSDDYFVKTNLRYRILSLIQEECDLLYDVSSPFLITVKLFHPTSEEDCTPVVSLAWPRLQSNKKKKPKFVISTVNVNEAIAALSFQEYQKNCFFLTPVSENCAFEIEFSHKPVFVGGRYNKYSRTLSQTPWIVDGQRKSESSVEELICEKISSLVRCDCHKFSSSGREDVDVQMLGTGRPFLVELLNPKNISFSKENLEIVEQEINKSTTDIQVRNLSQVSKEATDVIRKSNEDKKKHYSALIWTPEEITPEAVAFLNDTKFLEIAQKTPIRVLHRRSQAVRKRIIYQFVAKFMNSHHFTLCLSTQAGTYIKEFVHGDFGRTQPNLRLLMKQDVDILQLDVLEVEVEWPI